MGNLCTFLSGFFFLLVCFFTFLLEYSWFKMLCYFQVNSKVNQLYIGIYTLFFKIIFPYRPLQSIAFPVLNSSFLLVIYFIYSSVYMSVPISQFIPSHLPLNFAVNLKLLPKWSLLKYNNIQYLICESHHPSSVHLSTKFSHVVYCMWVIWMWVPPRQR